MHHPRLHQFGAKNRITPRIPEFSCFGRTDLRENVFVVWRFFCSCAEKCSSKLGDVVFVRNRDNGGTHKGNSTIQRIQKSSLCFMAGGGQSLPLESSTDRRNVIFSVRDIIFHSRHNFSDMKHLSGHQDCLSTHPKGCRPLHVHNGRP